MTKAKLKQLEHIVENGDLLDRMSIALDIRDYINALEAAKAYDTYVIENNLEHTINGVLK